MKQHRTNQAGFSAGAIIAIVLVIFVIGGVGVVVFKKSNSKQATTDNPATEAKQNVPDDTPGQQSEAAYAGWKQYSNAKYGFSFYYPENWRVEERDAATSTLEVQKAELSLWLVNDSYKTNPELAALTVSGNSKQQSIDLIEGDITAHARGEVDKYRSISNVSVNGKEAVKYSIGQSKTANRQIYFLSGGGKSYSVSTTGEDRNIERSATYIDDFEKLVQSLRLP
jgi:hypothetical protein